MASKYTNLFNFLSCLIYDFQILLEEYRTKFSVDYDFLEDAKDKFFFQSSTISGFIEFYFLQNFSVLHKNSFSIIQK